MNCVYQPVEGEPGVYRCIHPGCGITFRRVTDPARIRPGKCQSPVMVETLERAGLTARCVHRGEPTGESVKGCGCGVPAWQTEYHKCELHGQCVLLHLAKRPGVRSCEKCGDDPARPKSTGCPLPD